MMTVMQSECVYVNCLTWLMSLSCSADQNPFDDLELQNVNDYVHVHVLQHVLIKYVLIEHRNYTVSQKKTVPTYFLLLACHT